MQCMLGAEGEVFASREEDEMWMGDKTPRSPALSYRSNAPPRMDDRLLLSRMMMMIIKTPGISVAMV